MIATPMTLYEEPVWTRVGWRAPQELRAVLLQPRGLPLGRPGIPSDPATSAVRELALVEPPSSRSDQEPHALAPAALLLGSLTLLLVVFRHAAETRARRSRAPAPSGGPPPLEAASLPEEDVDRLDSTQPVAVLLVGGENALGPASVRIFGKLYANEYPQILFVSVGVMDFAAMDRGPKGRGSLKGSLEAKGLRRKTRRALDPYLAGAHHLGLRADCRVSVATDVVDEIDLLSDEITAVYPRAAFFVSKLVFQKPKWFHRILHSGSGDAIRTRLEKKGRPITVLPFVVPV